MYNYEVAHWFEKELIVPQDKCHYTIYPQFIEKRNELEIEFNDEYFISRIHMPKEEYRKYMEPGNFVVHYMKRRYNYDIIKIFNKEFIEKEKHYTPLRYLRILYECKLNHHPFPCKVFYWNIHEKNQWNVNVYTCRNSIEYHDYMYLRKFPNYGPSNTSVSYFLLKRDNYERV